MNILFVTTTLPRFVNDNQSSFVLEQVQTWKQLRPNDGVHILAPDDVQAQKEEETDGVLIHRYQYFWPRFLQQLPYPALLPNICRNPFLLLQLPFLMLSEYFAIKNLLRKHKMDVVYAHWVVPSGLIAWLVLRISNIARLPARQEHRTSKLVVQNHSSDLRILTKIPFVGKRIARSIIRSSYRFFCVNSLLKQEVLKLFSLREQKEIDKKVVVLPMGVTFNEIARLPARQASADSVGPRNDDKYKYDLGFIGRLSKKKGADLLIQALRMLDQPVSVGIAGEGEEEEDLRDQSSPRLRPASKINDMRINITLLGQISGEEKEQFFKETKIFIFPSLSLHGDIEGIPVALLEALVHEKLCIASEATNIQLLPEWDQIKQAVILVSDPKNIKELARTIQSVLQLSLSAVAKKTQGLELIMRRYVWKNLIKEYILN